MEIVKSEISTINIIYKVPIKKKKNEIKKYKFA